MNKLTNGYGNRFKSVLLLMFIALTSQSAFAINGEKYAMNLPEGVTDFSQEVYGLHMIVLWICVIIAVLVFGAMFYSIYAHRKSKGVIAAKFSHSMTAEIIWTVIPIVILIIIAFPATKALINMEVPTDADGNRLEMEMTVKVTGYQWKWKYEYLGENVSFLSSLAQKSNDARQLNSNIDPYEVENYLLEVDNPLVIPVDTNIRILLTANDVIHSWWVPSFGWKRDAIPGFVNEAWTNVKEVGTYRGQCAELCGKDHAFMPIVVEVKSKADYATWLQEQQDLAAKAKDKDNIEWSKADLMSQGQKVYNTQCASCHQTSGKGMPPAFPALAGNAIVNGVASEQIKSVVFGQDGTAMAAFGNMLSDSDIAAVITYTRNSWSNTAQDVVQPADVKKIKE
ncbi:MAG: cytochrome c oxidase subunit II [Proteobacteria bacterium]|nr:cytochrome c oxidase subunit II [Pseudomonadota bacterium]